MQNSKRFSQIDFNIPGIKMIGMELMKLVNVKDPDMLKIAQTAELDPAIFGSIISCANSSLFGSLTQIVDLRTAVTRLGLKELKRIIFHVVLESAFRSDSPDINKLLRSIWKQNLAVSLIMQRLVQDLPQVRNLPVEMVASVYPLGLMHIIGLPVLIANFFRPFAKYIQEDSSLPLPVFFARQQELFGGFDHFILGAELLKRWGFPEYFAEVIRCYHEAEPDLVPDVRTLHALLRYARHLADDLGYSALKTAPEGYWKAGNVLDISGVDTVALGQDVLEQMQELTVLFQ